MWILLQRKFIRMLTRKDFEKYINSFTRGLELVIKFGLFKTKLNFLKTEAIFLQSKEKTEVTF